MQHVPDIAVCRRHAAGLEIRELGDHPGKFHSEGAAHLLLRLLPFCKDRCERVSDDALAHATVPGVFFEEAIALHDRSILGICTGDRGLLAKT